MRLSLLGGIRAQQEICKSYTPSVFGAGYSPDRSLAPATPLDWDGALEPIVCESLESCVEARAKRSEPSELTHLFDPDIKTDMIVTSIIYFTATLAVEHVMARPQLRAALSRFCCCGCFSSCCKSKSKSKRDREGDRQGTDPVLARSPSDVSLIVSHGSGGGDEDVRREARRIAEEVAPLLAAGVGCDGDDRNSNSNSNSNNNNSNNNNRDHSAATVATEAAIAAAAQDPVALCELRKVYRVRDKRGRRADKEAVKSLSFGVAPGECFGFLGVNGAGKTTTLKMLAGEVLPTSGSAWLGGRNVETEQALVREQVGYCAQQNTILDLLTVREHLELFAGTCFVSPRRLFSLLFSSHFHKHHSPPQPSTAAPRPRQRAASAASRPR